MHHPQFTKIEFSRSLILLVILFFNILTFETLAAPSETMGKKELIAVGDANFPPFTYLENGVPKGFVIDLLNEISKRQKLKITINLTDWTSAVQAINNNKAEILAGVSLIEKRRENFDFSERMLTMKTHMFVQRESFALTKIGDIKESTRVGAEKGDVSSQYFHILRPEIKQIEFTDQQAAIEALANGKIDVAILDYYSGMHTVERLKLTEKIKLIGDPIVETPYCFGVKKNSNTEILNILNNGLEEIKNDGAMKSLQNRYFGIGYFSNENWLQILYALILIVFIAIILFVWNISLHNAVKKRTVQLAESNELFRLYMEYSPVYMFFKDKKLNALKLSNNFESLFRKPINELIGTHISEYFPSERAKDIDDIDLKVIGDGKPIEIIEEINGRIFNTIKFPIKIKGEPSFIAGFMIDITEQKRTEQLLTQEKERLAITLKSIGDGVITTDVNGNIVTINKVAEKLTGWSLSDAVGHPLPEIFNVVNEITRQKCESPVEQVIKTDDVVELADHTCLLSKDGSEILITDRGAPIRDNEGNIIGVVLVFRDTTEEQKLQDSMQRAQKLESLGVLAGGIAHDFNNLLGGIFGYFDLANECIANDKMQQVSVYLSKAFDVFGRAKALTQQLLTFSKGGAPIRKTIQIAPLVKKSTQFVLSGSNVASQFSIADNLWLCDCDENQIGQVIDNIVINAKQAMAMGGVIDVKIENVQIDQVHQKKSVNLHDFIKISIKDYGIGMPREIISRIFDPFFSTKEAGHGLGLATVFSIVQRHDGWIEVESEPGKGSTFHIYLPASKEKLTSNLIECPSKHRGYGTVLVMDDEDFILDVVDEMLQGMGYNVVKTKSGEEVIHLFSDAVENGQSFVACILDLTIPGGMGGRETAIALREIDDEVILVASSGYSDDPIMSNPVEHGFSERITKPFRKNDLVMLMEKISTNCVPANINIK